MLNYNNLIEDYIEERLSGSELIDFENELNINPLLFREVERRREILKALDTLRLKKKVKAAITNPSSRQIGIVSINKWWAIAATLIISTVVIWLWSENDTYTDIAEEQMNKSNNEKPIEIQDSAVALMNQLDSTKPSIDVEGVISLAYEDIAKSNILIPQESVVRSIDEFRDTSNISHVDLALYFMREHEYSKAAIHLSKVPKGEMTEPIMFIKAYCLFQTGQYSSAAHEYNRLKDDLQFAYEAQWNYLVCKLALKDFKFVDFQLEKMTRDKYFPYNSKAIKLKESLKKTSG